MAKFKIRTVRDTNTVRKFTFKIRDLYQKYNFEASTKASSVEEAKQKIKERLVGWANMMILKVVDDLGTQYFGNKLINFKDSDEFDKKVYDMALSRTDAMDRCIGLGKRFIEHFDKIYKEPKSQSVDFWKKEMINHFNQVKQIKLKTTNNPILDGELRDWFFTAGANPQDYMKNPTVEELQAYDKFVTKLLSGGTIDNSLSITDGEEIPYNEHTAEYMLRSGINAENNAIAEYTPWIERLMEMYNETGDEKYLKAAESITDINNEEKKHVGEFGQALSNLSPEEGKLTVEGMQEVEDLSIQDGKVEDSTFYYILKKDYGKSLFIPQNYINANSKEDAEKQLNNKFGIGNWEFSKGTVEDIHNIDSSIVDDNNLMTREQYSKRLQEEFGWTKQGADAFAKITPDNALNEQSLAKVKNYKNKVEAKDETPTYKKGQKYSYNGDTFIITGLKEVLADVHTGRKGLVYTMTKYPHGYEFTMPVWQFDKWVQEKPSYKLVDATPTEQQIKEFAKKKGLSYVDAKRALEEDDDNFQEIMQHNQYDSDIQDGSIDGDFSRDMDYIFNKTIEEGEYKLTQLVDKVYKNLRAYAKTYDKDQIESYIYSNEGSLSNKYNVIIKDKDLVAGDVVEETSESKTTKPVEEPKPIKDKMPATLIVEICKLGVDYPKFLGEDVYDFEITSGNIDEQKLKYLLPKSSSYHIKDNHLIVNY